MRQMMGENARVEVSYGRCVIYLIVRYWSWWYLDRWSLELLTGQMVGVRLEQRTLLRGVRSQRRSPDPFMVC